MDQKFKTFLAFPKIKTKLTIKIFSNQFSIEILFLRFTLHLTFHSASCNALPIEKPLECVVRIGHYYNIVIVQSAKKRKQVKTSPEGLVIFRIAMHSDLLRFRSGHRLYHYRCKTYHSQFPVPRDYLGSSYPGG